MEGMYQQRSNNTLKRQSGHMDGPLERHTGQGGPGPCRQRGKCSGTVMAVS